MAVMPMTDILDQAVGADTDQGNHTTEEIRRIEQLLATSVPEEAYFGTVPIQFDAEDVKDGPKTPIQESGMKEGHHILETLEKNDHQPYRLQTPDEEQEDDNLARSAARSLGPEDLENPTTDAIQTSPNSPDLIADHQLEDPAQERDPALDTENTTSTPNEEDAWTTARFLLLIVMIKDGDKKKSRLQKKSKGKKMKKNKPSPAIASSVHCWDITKVENLRPWWKIGLLVVILLCMHSSADAINIPASVCTGQTAALNLNTEGPVKGPYTVYKGIFRKSKVVYSNEIVSNCPPRPYVIPDDQSYLFCNSDNGTALLLVSNVTLEHNSKFTVEYTTQDDNPGSKETSLQVNSTECPSKTTNQDSHNGDYIFVTQILNTQSNLGEGPNIPVLCGSVAGVALFIALALAGYCLIKRRNKAGAQNTIELHQVDACSRSAEDGQQAVTGNGYQPIASRDAEGSAENRLQLCSSYCTEISILSNYLVKSREVDFNRIL
ncbi:hypothetical protein AOXY_G27328 [Acipenser oxyrinchus oxyrinchus]|uniref:Uncharacterized protein n=1 Tax=Acipenser oxyrinchus oxyrinchus TaxID=40147 RepID=A0AAD8CQP2_ACIOX|nr:hypothetical protein AOXY_G27328 [Acipenser oxyrinchus oxyrinchus]